MLIDPKFIQSDHSDILAIIGNGDPKPRRVREGIYEISHFSFSAYLAGSGSGGVKGPWEEYPDVGEGQGRLTEYGSYGVCDSVDQFLRHPLGKWLVESERKFTVSFTKICKATEPKEGGWRWHKWGEYIGEFQPECEYLADESEVEEVSCYHILEFIEGKTKSRK